MHLGLETYNDDILLQSNNLSELDNIYMRTYKDKNG